MPNKNPNPHGYSLMLDFYRFREVHDLFSQGLVDEAKALLASLQERYIALCDENNMLKRQARELEDVLHLPKNLIYDGSVYWLFGGKIQQGPFCYDCYSREGVLLKLTEATELWLCGQCGWNVQRDATVASTAFRASPAENFGDDSDNTPINKLAEKTHQSEFASFTAATSNWLTASSFGSDK